MPALKALETALESVHTLPGDAAAVELARRYSRELDEAVVVAASLTKALRELLELDADLHDRFLVLTTRIEATAVAAAVGPKLLAVLEQLGMTPAGRARLLGREGGGGRGDGSRGSKLDELRERRAARQHSAPSVD